MEYCDGFPRTIARENTKLQGRQTVIQPCTREENFAPISPSVEIYTIDYVNQIQMDDANGVSRILFSRFDNGIWTIGVDECGWIWEGTCPRGSWKQEGINARTSILLQLHLQDYSPFN